MPALPENRTSGAYHRLILSALTPYAEGATEGLPIKIGAKVLLFLEIIWYFCFFSYLCTQITNV